MYNPSSTIWQRNMAPLSKTCETVENNSTASPQVNTIKWDHFVAKEEVLEGANVLDMEIKLLKNRLRWMGHICRMNDTRPVKALASWKVLEKWVVHFCVTRTRAKWLCSVVKF